MNDTGIRPEVIEEIRNLAQKYDIEKVILFGSRARGDFRRTSDIDIAVTGGDFARFARRRWGRPPARHKNNIQTAHEAWAGS